MYYEDMERLCNLEEREEVINRVKKYLYEHGTSVIIVEYADEKFLLDLLFKEHGLIYEDFI